MIVFCNGTYKSGSSLLRLLTEQLCQSQKIIDENLNRAHGDRFTYDQEIEYILDQYSGKEDFYVLKTHCYNYPLLKKIVISNKLLLIDRNINDVLISHFYHVINSRKKDMSFSLYFVFFGFFKLNQIIYYNHINKRLNGNPNVFSTRFEALTRNKRSEIIRLASFLNIDISKELVDKLLEDTTLDNFRKKYSSRRWFFRKGETGEFSHEIPGVIKRFINWYILNCPVLINQYITKVVFFKKK